MVIRGYSHLHYIRTIKNGSILKIMNVGKRRKPALVFKKVEDIYKADDPKNPHLLRVRRKKDEFMKVFSGGYRFESDRSRSYVEDRNAIKIESDDQKDDDSDDKSCDKMTLNQLMSMARAKIDPNTCEPNGNNDGYRVDSESDDQSCDKMTLNQLMSMARAKIDPNTREPNGNNDGYRIDSDSDDIDCDKMTLNQLKVIEGRKKRKLPSYVDLIKPDNKIWSPMKEEHPNLTLMNGDVDLEMPLSYFKQKPLKKKLRISNCVSSSSQSTTTVSVKSEIIPSDEGHIHLSEHISFAINVKNEVLEPDELDFQSAPRLTYDSFVCGDKDVGSIINNSEMIETADEYVDCVLTNEELVSFTDTLNCVVNEISYDHLECHRFGSITDVNVTDITMEKMKVNALGMNIHQSYILPLSELNVQEKCSEEAQKPGTSINNSLHCLESIDPCGVCFSGTDKDHLCCKLNSEFGNSSMSNYSSPSKSSPYLIPDNSFWDDVNEDSTTFDMKQAQSCDISHKLLTPDLATICDAEVQHPPERLLSNRKAISPASQEKLCKQMSDCGLQDEDIEQLKCRENLCFENEKESQNSASPELDDSKSDVTVEAQLTTSDKRTGRIKIYSKGPILKGNLKVHPLSHVSTKWTSIQSCSHSAIAFSQRQMQDIESLAVKLRKELNSIKEIVEDALHSEAYLSTSLIYNADEVKSTIESAKKVDKISKKCLITMARDSDRFCKIMTLTEKDSASSGNPVFSQTEKKITFADEAGGELCHVKIFDDDSFTSVAP